MIVAQFLPSEISCFAADFDVTKAREEFRRAKLLLEEEEVKVVLVEELWARMIEDMGIKPKRTRDELKREIIRRAERYQGENYPEKGSRLDAQTINWIDHLIDEDVLAYGEEAAIVINEILSLDGNLPMGNVVYARDQSNLIGGVWVYSSMRHPIRRAEVDLYQQVLEYHGLSSQRGIKTIRVGGEGMFEGGDAFVNSGIAYIGVGGRTNMEGVFQVAGSILDEGKRVIVAYDQVRDEGAESEMDAMHLDTFCMPSDLNEMVVCAQEAKRRKALEVTRGGNGSFELRELGSFCDHLVGRGVDIIEIGKSEQVNHASNFLHLGNGRMVLSISQESSLVEELERRGKTVYNAQLDNITKGYGGLHCMTAALERG